MEVSSPDLRSDLKVAEMMEPSFFYVQTVLFRITTVASFWEVVVRHLMSASERNPLFVVQTTTRYCYKPSLPGT